MHRGSINFKILRRFSILFLMFIKRTHFQKTKCALRKSIGWFQLCDLGTSITKNTRISHTCKLLKVEKGDNSMKWAT